jgi:hypothetical protein
MKPRRIYRLFTGLLQQAVDSSRVEQVERTDTVLEEADRNNSREEVDRHMLEPQADRILLEAVVLDVPQPCSIAAVRRLCMEPVVSEQRCKTFLIKFGRLNHDQ